MKNIMILIQFIVVAMTNNDSIDCNKYFSKFGTKESPIAFSGDAVYIEESQEIQINVKYTDALFEDPIYFGLVLEDEKKPETTCLELKVLQLTNTDHQSSQLISDLKIIPQNNSINQQRQYSFKIPISQLDQNLLSNTTDNVYEGYYSINFESTNQVTFNMNLSLISLLLQIRILKNQLRPHQNIKIQLNKKIPMFPNQNCIGVLTLIANLILMNLQLSPQPKDLLYNKQSSVVKNKQFLNNTEVWLQGNGVNKNEIPIRINNTTPGQVIIQLKANIAWNKLYIKVISALSESPSIRNIETIIETSFRPISKDRTRLRWCSDLNCQSFLKKFQACTLMIDEDQLFTETKVWFTGDGLNKTVTPVQVMSSSLNFVIVQLKAEVIWKSIKIQVTSNISKSTQVQDSVEQITVITDEITCIKPEGKEDCATYECEVCDNYGFLPFVHLILLLVVII